MAKILLVEDDKDIQELVCLRLEIAGHDVVVADNGKIGYEKALQNPHDLILMDMHMPVMNGHETVKALRENDYSGLIIALTASALTNETNAALNVGCDAVIIKPISEKFEDQILELLSLQT